MSLEFQSNPAASFLWTYNYKLQFDCTGFYGGTPLVISSDPLAPIISYNQPGNYFQFAVLIGVPVSFMGAIVTPMNLTPPIQGGVPVIIPQKNYGLWYSMDGVDIDGIEYAAFTIGAQINNAGASIAQLPDLVMCQIILNSDYRARYPSSQATPPSPGPI